MRIAIRYVDIDVERRRIYLFIDFLFGDRPLFIIKNDNAKIGVTNSVGNLSLRSPLAFLLLLLTASFSISGVANAHVKWFASYDVSQTPRTIEFVLASQSFWTAVFLSVIGFTFSIFVERSKFGNLISDFLNFLCNPLSQRMDDFVRIATGFFFICLFASGNVYLTPELTTPDEYVSWLHFIIGFSIIFRSTRMIAAIGIMALWFLALRDYDFFHLLDYLPLQIGLSAYFILEGVQRPEWRTRRFEALRWGLAVAIMWSSLEKFAYADWFIPILNEHPYITLGLPQYSFVIMSGVAEFAMGFGLLWTPLTRRFSALALILIFSSAIILFGRTDLIGHSLIIAILLITLVDQTPYDAPLTQLKNHYSNVLVMGCASFVLFSSSYWGLHRMIYDPEFNLAAVLVATAQAAPVSPPKPKLANQTCGTPINLENETDAQSAYEKAMRSMHGPMMMGMKHPDADKAFVLGMIPHHQGALDMAKIQLKFGKDRRMRRLAFDILRSQHLEVIQMDRWLRENNVASRCELFCQSKAE